MYRKASLLILHTAKYYYLVAILSIYVISKKLNSIRKENI